MRSARCFLAALLPVCLAGCSTDTTRIDHVKTEAIHQIYAVTWNAAKDRTDAYARFRVGGSSGTNLELTDRASVVWNRQPLAAMSFLGKCYGLTSPGFTAEHTFVFTDADGRTFTNPVRLERIDLDRAMPAKLSRGVPHTLRFAGAPVGDGETVTLTITPERDLAALRKQLDDLPADPQDQLQRPGRTAATLHAKTVGATGIEVTPADLQGLANGAASVRWVRSVRRDLQQATPAGGSLTAMALSNEAAITLED